MLKIYLLIGLILWALSMLAIVFGWIGSKLWLMYVKKHEFLENWDYESEKNLFDNTFAEIKEDLGPTLKWFIVMSIIFVLIWPISIITNIIGLFKDKRA